MYSEKKENTKNRTKPFLLLIAAFVAVILATAVLAKLGVPQSAVQTVRLLLVPAAAAGIFLLIKKYMYFVYFCYGRRTSLCLQKHRQQRIRALQIKNIEMRNLVRDKEEVEKLLADNEKAMKNDCRVGEDRAKDAALLYKDFNANRDVVLLFEPSDELFTIISESMLDKAE